MRKNSMKRILTYTSFNLLYYGHMGLLRRERSMKDYLIVELFTDEFNILKGKRTYFDYETRKNILESIRYVDLVIEEN